LYRLLQWNPWVDLLCRAVEVLRRLRFPSGRATEIEVWMPRSALALNPRKATPHASPTSRKNQQATVVDTLMLHTRSPLSECFRPRGETLVLGLVHRPQADLLVLAGARERLAVG